MALGAAIYVVAVAATAQEATWRGLTIAEPERCSPFERKRDYPYSQALRDKIAERQGGVFGPYTLTCLGSPHAGDIEHIVAAAEAHDSGLCAADRDTRKAFANDLRNLTLALPRVNRWEKSDKDAGEWLPPENRCWFAVTILRVKRAYALAVDWEEVGALEAILDQCESVVMVKPECGE